MKPMSAPQGSNREAAGQPCGGFRTKSVLHRELRLPIGRLRILSRILCRSSPSRNFTLCHVDAGRWRRGKAKNLVPAMEDCLIS